MPAPPRAALWHRLVAGTLKAVLPLALIATAVWSWNQINATAPPPVRAARAPEPRFVRVVPAAKAVSGPLVVAHGRVAPARTVSLAPDIAGRVVEIAPGLVRHGRLAAGEVAFALDTRALALELAEAEARVAEIDARILTERGQAERAARDYARLPYEVTPEQEALILRKPQMAGLEAERAAALAEVERARLDLDEAVVRAPFDAVVLSDSVEPGTRLAAGEEAARLAATDRFRVDLTVPLPALGWVAPGDEVRLTWPSLWPEDAYRIGVVERIGTELTGGGSLAEVSVILDAPLDPAEGLPVVRLGAFLRAVVEAPAVPGTVELSRDHLRDGGQVWVMDAEDRLDIRDIEVLWRGPDTVLVSRGLEPGERVVVTPLPTRAEGMALRTGAATDTAEADGRRDG